MPTQRIENALRQFLGTVHRDLPGAVFQGGVGKARQQLPGVVTRVHPLDGLQGERLFVDHQFLDRGAQRNVVHAVADMGVAGQIDQPGEKRMAAV